MSHLTFTLIQTNLHWEDKAANLQMLEEKINALQHPTQIIVLPEMFNTGFSMKPEQYAEDMQGPTVQWMKKIAAEKGIDLNMIAGSGDSGRVVKRDIESWHPSKMPVMPQFAAVSGQES